VVAQRPYSSTPADGLPRSAEPKTVEATSNAGGALARLLGLPKLADAKPLTRVEAPNIERLPDRPVVLGGYVGPELPRRCDVSGVA
jgi:hypothetical protein